MVEKRRTLPADADVPSNGDSERQYKRQMTEHRGLNGLATVSSVFTTADDARPMSVDLPTPTPDEAEAAMDVDADAPAVVQGVETGAFTEEHASLVFRHDLLVLTSHKRIVTPALADALGCQWRVVWYPHGVVDGSYASVFVEMVVDESREHPEDQEELVRHAEVEIAVLRRPDGAAGYERASTAHAFSRETHEFGVSELVPRSQLLDPARGFLGTDGCVCVDVRLCFVHPDPLAVQTGADGSGVNSSGADAAAMALAAQQLRLRLGDSTLEAVTSAEDLDEGESRRLEAYDSKHATGMVGLKNQGATCYLNSLLQTLFHLRAFRRVVYETPTRSEDTTSSVSLALQRVFYRLQRQRKAVSTKELTRSFGWSQVDSFMQHDVQELYRILCDRLEDKMKHTRVDSAIKRLFEGRVRSFIRCVDVDFQSSREESFYDLQLDVKGCRDVHESLRKYVETELLQGDNQYEAEGLGKQDAEKGVSFLQLPPVLNLQLKRFEYDPLRVGMVKIHDRFEYPTTLVLDEFLQDEADKDSKDSGDKDSGDKDSSDSSPKHIYHLHSVLVHSGDVHGGHYYVFIRPARELAASKDWFRFDDDQITRVDECVAVDGNFGSAPSTATNDSTAHPTSPLYSSSLISSPDPAARAQDETGGLEFRSMDMPTPEDRDATGGADDVYDFGRTDGDAASSSGLTLPLARSFSSAYMLVYVRDGLNDISAIGDPLEVVPSSQDVEMPTQPSQEDVEVDEDDTDDAETDAVAVPLALVERFRKEEKAAARRKKLQQTDHLFMSLRVASDTSVAGLKRFTKSVDFSQFGNSACLRVRMRRSGHIRELYKRVYELSGVPVTRQRLWKIITRENRTHRPDQPLLPDTLDLRVDSLIDDDASPKAPVRLYLQILGPSEAKCVVHRHVWSEFTAPEVEIEAEKDAGSQDGDQDEDEAADGLDAVEDVGCCPAELGEHDILLFVKFYNLKQPLGDRLQYVGNLLIDARRTGQELARYLHEALEISASRELVLYEEIQPTSVHEIEPGTTLLAAEIQHGDIICYQFADPEAGDEALSSKLEADDEPDPGMDVKLVPQDEEDSLDAVSLALPSAAFAPDNDPVERYPDVPSYFRYLLDRVEVTFQRYGHADDRFTLELLQSNVYDEVVDAVAARLGLVGDQRLHLRLYQHSPLNGQPMRSPLRHSRYAGDTRTTLEELLTEYLERTTTMYFEELPCPITEIEAKKTLLVYFSAYDACFTESSGSRGGQMRRVELLVLPTDTTRDLQRMVRESFELSESVKLRVCEAVQHGTVVRAVLDEDSPLDRYWLGGFGGGSHGSSETPALFVECVPEDEEEGGEEVEDDLVFVKGVTHFSFQANSQTWILPHGSPLVVRFREKETVAQVKARIRHRLGVSSETFDRWNLALVKDLKATTVCEQFAELDAEAVDALPMAQLQVVCGSEYQDISSFGLEHADPAPKGMSGTRHREQGIHIRHD